MDLQGVRVFPKKFDYYSPKTISEAIGLIDELKDAKVLAGGQSLLPMMKLRLATPAALIDLSNINGELGSIVQDKSSVEIGAMARIAELAKSKAVQKSLPALYDASLVIADTQVRNMGTIGGNLANADPNNDMPVVALALNAKMEVRNKNGKRLEGADGFFVGPYTTKIAENELLTKIIFPVEHGRFGSAYSRIERRIGDYALAAAATSIKLESSGKVTDARIAVAGISMNAIRLEAVEKALIGAKPDQKTTNEITLKTVKDIDVEDSYYATASTKRMAVAYAVQKSLDKAYERAKAKK